MICLLRDSIRGYITSNSSKLQQKHLQKREKGHGNDSDDDDVQRSLQVEIEKYVQTILELYVRSWVTDVSPTQTLDVEVMEDTGRQRDFSSRESLQLLLNLCTL